MIYVFDTSSFVVLKNFYPANFPSLWDEWNELALKGTVISVREVKSELENRDNTDFIQDWVKQNKSIFMTPTSDELRFVSEIFSVSHFQALISNKATLQGTLVADPFVIAAARVKGGTVVTEEKLKPNAAKIPNVCQHFKIPCINLEGFMSQQSWSF